MNRKTDAPKVTISAKARPQVKEAIERLAREDDRPFCNMVALLLEKSPRVQSKLKELEAQTA